MKHLKFYLLSCFLLVSVLAFSQYRGQKSVGGALGLSLTASEGQTSFALYLAPEFNVFVGNNSNLGLSIQYNLQAPEQHTMLFMPQYYYYLKMNEVLYYTPGILIGGGFSHFLGDNYGAFATQLNLFALECHPTRSVGLAFNFFSVAFVGLFTPFGNTAAIGLNINASSSVCVKYYF